MALVLLATMAQAASVRPLDRRPCRAEGRSRWCVDPGSGGSGGGGGGAAPVWSFLPPNGSGVPVMDPSGVCDAFASELVGQYVCMRGDGSALLGAGVTLTKSGNVATISAPVCPNGVNCDAITAQAFDGIGAWTGNQSAAPAGDFSLCALARVRAEGINASQIRYSTSTYVQLAFNGAPTAGGFQVQGVGPTSTISAPGSWIFACGTYQRVGGASNNVGHFYVNGVLGNSSSTMLLPLAGSFEVASSLAGGRQDIALAIYTEKVLSAATIQSMSQQIFGTLTATDGSAVTQARTSDMHCLQPDGVLSLVPSGRQCIQQPAGILGPAVYLEGSKTNSLIQSQALNTWTQAGVTTAANVIAAPTAAETADRLADDTSTGEHMVTRAPTLTSQAHAASAFFKAGTSGFAFLKYSTTHYGYINLATGAVSATGTGATVAADALANGWWRLKLNIPAANATANPVIGLGIAAALGTSSYTGAGTGSIYAWGAQLEAGAMASSYIRTDASARGLMSALRGRHEARAPRRASAPAGHGARRCADHPQRPRHGGDHPRQPRSRGCCGARCLSNGAGMADVSCVGARIHRRISQWPGGACIGDPRRASGAHRIGASAALALCSDGHHGLDGAGLAEWAATARLVGVRGARRQGGAAAGGASF